MKEIKNMFLSLLCFIIFAQIRFLPPFVYAKAVSDMAKITAIKLPKSDFFL